MKLLLENWRRFLKEDEEKELQQDLINFIKKNKLKRNDLVKIIKSANLEENTLNEAIGQDLIDLYNKYGKKAITMALIAAIGTGAIAPKAAHASAYDTARIGMMVASKPSIVKDASAIFNLVTYQGDERGALEHLKSIIETVGGIEKAKNLIDDISNSDHTINFGVKMATNNIEKRIESTTPNPAPPYGSGVSNSEWEAINPLLAEYEAINNNLSGYEGIKNVVKYELGEEYANKIEGLLGNITAEMGWGNNPAEVRAYANDLANKISEIDGRPIDQIHYLE